MPAHRLETAIVENAGGVDAGLLAFVVADDHLVDRIALDMELVERVVAGDRRQGRLEIVRHADDGHALALGIDHRHAPRQKVAGDACQILRCKGIVGQHAASAQVELAIDGDEVFQPQPANDLLQRPGKDIPCPAGGDGGDHTTPLQAGKGLFDAGRELAGGLAVDGVVDVEERDPDAVFQGLGHGVGSHVPLGHVRSVRSEKKGRLMRSGPAWLPPSSVAASPG